MHKKLIENILIIVVIFIFIITNYGQATEDVLIKKIKAETNNQLSIAIKTPKTKVITGEDIPIIVEVKNNGKKPIFLVKHKNIDFTDKNDNVFISYPYPVPRHKEGYGYSFHKIKPKQTHKIKFVIPSNLNKKERYLDVTVGLGFVYDKTGIDRKLELLEDPLILRGPLSSRLETLAIGRLNLISAISDD